MHARSVYAREKRFVHVHLVFTQLKSDVQTTCCCNYIIFVSEYFLLFHVESGVASNFTISIVGTDL